MKIKTAWPENEGFLLERKNKNECVFIHMSSRALLNEKDKIRLCPSGSCILYPPNSYQHLEALSEGLIHDWAHLTPDALPLFEKFGIFPETLYELSEDKFVTSIFREMERECMNRRAYSEELCEAKLCELLIGISRAIASEDPETVSPNLYAALSELRETIHLNYQKKWSVHEMADSVHLSASRFHAVYKTVFGISPKNDLLITRLEHAKRLLTDKNRTVAEVADMTGYDNVYHFIRAFKKFCGKTPGEYRAEHEEKAEKSQKMLSVL